MFVLVHGTDLEKLVLINCLLAWLGIPKHRVSFPQSRLAWVSRGIQPAAWQSVWQASGVTQGEDN